MSNAVEVSQGVKKHERLIPDLVCPMVRYEGCGTGF